MFFDPKMQLVWVDGPLEKLDAFIENRCVDGKRVHPARALTNLLQQFLPKSSLIFQAP